MKTNIGHEATHYSPDEQARILAVARENTHTVPDGWLSAALIQKNYGIHTRIVDRIARDQGVTGSRIRNRQGREGTYFSPEEVAVIVQNAPERIEIAEAPEGYLAMKALEQATGWSDATIVKRVKIMGLEWKEYRNSRGRAARFLSPEDIERLKSYTDR